MSVTEMETTKAPAPTVDPRRQWVERPVAAAVVRTAFLVVPFASATMAGVVAGWSVGGNGVGSAVVRLAVAAVASVVVFVTVERLARRFLPLVTLLKLTLVFPDRVPSRFAVALRSTSVRRLQEWAQQAQHDLGTAALAEKVVTLGAALNNHDRRTRGHSERTRALADLLAVEMGLDEAAVNEVRWGAFLHDIGKILVPSAVLNKPGAPTAGEWEVLRRHPGDGGRLVEALRPFLGCGVEAVTEHHENFDGTGYPDGLAGQQIALAARIVSVADSFEVITAVRSYKKPMKASEAREEIARHSGTQFDPAVVRALLNVTLGKLHWRMGLAAWAAEIPLLTFIPRAAAQVGGVLSGPTLSMGALSGVAAVSLGSAVVAPMAFARPASPPPAPAASAAPAGTLVDPTGSPAPATAPSATSTSTSSSGNPLGISISGADAGPGSGSGTSSTVVPGSVSAAAVAASGTGPTGTTEPVATVAAGVASAVSSAVAHPTPATPATPVTSGGQGTPAAPVTPSTPATSGGGAASPTPATPATPVTSGGQGTPATPSIEAMPANTGGSADAGGSANTGGSANAGGTASAGGSASAGGTGAPA
ncbi:MAG: HD-GYP domain-containing protein [Acidimicrobiales bacterium]